MILKFSVPRDRFKFRQVNVFERLRIMIDEAISRLPYHRGRQWAIVAMNKCEITPDHVDVEYEVESMNRIQWAAWYGQRGGDYATDGGSSCPDERVHGGL